MHLHSVCPALHASATHGASSLKPIPPCLPLPCPPRPTGLYPGSLEPFFPASSFELGVRGVRLLVGGEVVEELGPLACCHGFMDTGTAVKSNFP